MPEADHHWRKVDALLRATVTSDDAAERGRLIEEAISWRQQAIAAERAAATAAIPSADDPPSPDVRTPD